MWDSVWYPDDKISAPPCAFAYIEWAALVQEISMGSGAFASVGQDMELCRDGQFWSRLLSWMDISMRESKEAGLPRQTSSVRTLRSRPWEILPWEPSHSIHFLLWLCRILAHTPQLIFPAWQQATVCQAPPFWGCDRRLGGTFQWIACRRMSACHPFPTQWLLTWVLFP